MNKRDKFYNDILNKLETAINGLEIEIENQLNEDRSPILVVMQSLFELKEYVLKTEFVNEDEEISFFKYQKPVIVTKLIYYNAIYKIEVKKPHGRKEILEEYFNNKYQTSKLASMKICTFTATTGRKALILMKPIFCVAGTI